MNKIRLIDANALKKKLVKKSFKHNFNGYEVLLISEIEEFIDNAPTVEDERLQGEWYYSCDKGWECNQCHKTVKDMPIDDNKKATYDFCPNCGAKMAK